MPEKKAEKLFHVQRFAIRSLILSKVEAKEVENRYRQVKQRETKNINEALKRVDKATLIKIVERSPEITEGDIESCFEEYRYSRRPNFRLFLLRSHDPSLTSKKFLSDYKMNQGVNKLNQVFDEFKQASESIKELKVMDQTIIDPETMELAFSYQERYDYIDPDTEENNHIFQLKFGFLWINVDRKFLSISVPTDSLVPIIFSAVEKAFAAFVIPVNITQSVINNVFNKESMKGTSLFNPEPPPGFPQKISLSDSEMGQKISHLKEYAGYEMPGSTYQEQIDEELFSTLKVNCSKGKIYLTRQLKASQLRHWGLGRIKQIMGYINGVYAKSDIDELFETVGIADDRNLQLFANSKEEREVILEIVKGIVICKRRSLTSLRLINFTAEKLFQLLKKHAIPMFHPFCEECENYAEVICPSCGYSDTIKLQTKRGQVVAYCTFCHENLKPVALECIEGHSLQISSWFEGVQLKPLSALAEQVRVLINKYFKDVVFSLEEEYFYIQNNELYYSNTVATKVMYDVREIEQFKPVWSREISQERREHLDEILKTIKEKCSKQSNDGCRACQNEKSVLCIMKPFITFTDHKLHPHHGQEFGDVSFKINLGFEDAVYVGIAKSYEKSTVTESSAKGREMIQQFISKCMDERVHVLGLIIAADIDQGLIAMFQDLARKYRKKVVMWTYEELIMVVDYAIEQYDLDIKKVIKDIEKEIEKMKRGTRKKAG